MLSKVKGRDVGGVDDGLNDFDNHHHEPSPTSTVPGDHDHDRDPFSPREENLAGLLDGSDSYDGIAIEEKFDTTGEGLGTGVAEDGDNDDGDDVVMKDAVVNLARRFEEGTLLVHGGSRKGGIRCGTAPSSFGGNDDGGGLIDGVAEKISVNEDGDVMGMDLDITDGDDGSTGRSKKDNTDAGIPAVEKNKKEEGDANGSSNGWQDAVSETGREMNKHKALFVEANGNMEGGNDNGSSTGWQVVGDENNSIIMSCGSSKLESSDDDDFSFGSNEDDDVEKSYDLCNEIPVKAFDVNLLRGFIEKGEESLPFIEGKDVILVVGKTGTGKSSLIQGIAGKEFKQAVHTSEEDHTTTKEVFEAVDPVPGFEIGHAKSSMTRVIQCFSPNISIGTNKSKKRDNVYLDTPGFEDTNGAECDVATSVMLAQVSKKCRSLRFIVVINWISLLEDRGKSIRSVFKFMRQFVLDDFEKNKKSFMFLFTHADQIKDVPESLDGAKKSLLGEIVLTIEGTNDNEAAEVLSFIRKCLEKRHPFVQVVHPLRSDYSVIAGFAENTLKLVKVGTNSRNGSSALTDSSKFRLSGAIRIALETLKVLVKQDDVNNAKQICEIERTFHFFHKYIDYDDMRSAVAECKELIADHIKRLRCVVEAELRNGTTLLFSFSDANVDNLKNAIAQLQAIDFSFNTETEASRITRQVNNFQAELFIDISKASFNGYSQKLQKLKCWCRFENNYQQLIDPVVDHINNIVKESSSVVSKFNVSKILVSTENSLMNVFSHLKVVKSIIENGSSLSKHVDGISFALESANTFVSTFKSILEIWTEEIASPEMQIDFNNEEKVHSLSSKLHALEFISTLLNDYNLLDDCFGFVKTNRIFIESVVVEKYTSTCTDSKTCFQELDSESLFKQLTNLKVSLSLFSNLEGNQWKSMQFPYEEVVDRMKLLLKAKSGELDEMTNNMLHYGIVDGTRDGEALQSFDRCIWFDDFLRREERFVKKCAAKTRCEYFANFFASVESIDGIVFWFSRIDRFPQEPELLIETTKETNAILMQIEQYEHFGSAISDPSFSDLSSKLVDRLCKHVNNRSCCWKVTLSEWTEEISSDECNRGKIAAVSETLSIMVSEMTEMIGMPCCEKNKRIVQSHRTETIKKLSKFKQQVQHSIDSRVPRVSYEQFSFVLARVQALGDFPNISPHLPRIEEVKEAARHRISSDIKEIEDSIEATSDIDLVDSRVETVRQVITLSGFEFLSDEVNTRLRPITRLRNNKEIATDVHIKEMIDNKDFSGLRGFLEPLAKSKDNIKTKRFTQYAEMISNSVDKIDGKLQHVFYGEMTDEKGRAIASLLKVLEQLHEETSGYLPKPKKYNKSIKQKLTAIKERTDEKCSVLADKMLTATKNKDFALLASLNERTYIVLKHLGPYLHHRIKTNIEKAVTGFTDLKNSIPIEIEKFIDSSFTESLKIEKLLTELKRTTLKADQTFIDLSQLYRESKDALFRRVNGVIQVVIESVSDARCYDDSIIIIQNLIRSFRGLDDHLPHEFQNKCKSLLEEWCQARREQDSLMDFDGSSDEMNLRECRIMLDDLDPSSPWYKKAKGWITGRSTSCSYEKTVNRLSDKVNESHLRGMQALDRENFVAMSATVTRSFKFLNLVDTIIKEHVPSAPSKLHDLNKKATDSFRAICERSQDALQSDNFMKFELFFADFREFILSIESLTNDPNAMKSYHLINQLVNERLCSELSLLKNALNGFDFEAMKHKIEDVRKFGGFIADNFSLFHEELKQHAHVPTDKSLEEVQLLISKKFQNGRGLRKIKHYAVLGVVPSASIKEVKSAFRRLSKTCHPDKCRDKVEEFYMIKNACEEIERHETERDFSLKPFDEEIRGLGERLREATRMALDEQDYRHLETLLCKLMGIEIMENLVDPKLDTKKINDDIIVLIKNHVKKVRVEVESNWSQRKYQELNHNFKDLKMMEKHFISYPCVITSSWSQEIVKDIENNIDELGMEAKEFLRDPTVAIENKDEFRRCFMRMGSVLVELPLFQDYVKKVMSDILESCLNQSWGFTFVFELGRSLQQGDGIDNEDDARVAQNLVNAFVHFKEVQTMVWNEETLRKPPQATVKHIRGECLQDHTMKHVSVDVKKDELLEKYFEFESRYNSFLGEYLDEDSDHIALVQKIVAICKELKPMSCDDGFGNETRSKLPTIIAGVFALFTILKSGASYNRLADDPNGFDAKKLLMKPHNIQVLTLLCMFGCGTSDSSSLKNQLMQIRTGEGKSMILGAAATIFGLLGFEVRCVCYSEYLSHRDYELFYDVFDIFGLVRLINYSKITTLSEETTAKKGDMRGLTLSLMHDTLSSNRRGDKYHAIEHRRSGHEDDSMITETTPEKLSDLNKTNVQQSSPTQKRKVVEEIMLVDEVDVFFGGEFYGQTYDQVAVLEEPEIALMLKETWASYDKGGKKLRLADIKAMPAFQTLKAKVPRYGFLIENEIKLMLDQVRRVDDEPFYHLDRQSGNVGYKVQDTICYNVTHGYRTIFAYLKEAGNGNLIDENSTLARVLNMPVSCGQFSYANIKPTRILGVSGTLDVMSNYEKGVLQSYGVNQCLCVPSVYGESNFTFDKAADGLSIERGTDEFFQKINSEIDNITKNENRAAIVFFKNTRKLKEHTSSAFCRRLGRKKEILTESLNSNEKDFVIKKAATKGQITMCTAVFGRGTDFFCKDDALEKSGGVHVIQTFLSLDMSEEIQIQGRTARQGKQGSCKMILLDEDLEHDFGIERGICAKWPRVERYTMLCDARQKILEEKYKSIESSLSVTNQHDKATHQYFDALLDSNNRCANELLKDLYLNMKKTNVGEMNIDLAFAIDVTGSMTAYGPNIHSTITTLLSGPNSILAKLGTNFPDTAFELRVGVLGFRDIDDGSSQFQSKLLGGSSHFSENTNDVLNFVHTLIASTSGGADLAEDQFGAIQHCLDWDSGDDWNGTVKAIMLLTDAPAHGCASTTTSASVPNLDNYSLRHPSGITADSLVVNVLKKDIDLFICSFDPFATQEFEETLKKTYNDYPSNVEGPGIVTIPLVPKDALQRTSAKGSDANKHNIFVLDESGSMANNWHGVVSVYNKFMQIRRQRQHDSDLVSVVQFSYKSRVTCQLQSIIHAPTNLDFGDGGTFFSPAASSASHLAQHTPASHTPVVIFMSDGQASDSRDAAGIFSALNNIELHVIGFGGGTDTSQLQEIARASTSGKVHTASNIDSLSKVFVNIASGGDDVAKAVEAEIGKRISEAVTERLTAEYLA